MKYAFLLMVAMPSLTFCSGCNSNASNDGSQTNPATSANDDSPELDTTKKIDFASEVLPIFERSCYPCHGPEMSPVSMAGFRVDLREQAVGYSKIVPGKPDDSPLIKALITERDSKRMPPLKSDKPQLKPEQIDLLKRWIKQGADY